MKALVYEKAHSLADFATKLVEIPVPTPRENDVLVDVRAIGVNPGEAAIRSMRSAEPGGRVLLGWEFAGVVSAVGAAVARFKVGDRVFGTGDMTRDGCWAESVAVDHRVVAVIPEQLSFDDAASLPIGSATAWEAIFRDQDRLPAGVDRVLILGGAAGVGSLATQLLKARTNAFVISTGSRAESQEWCRKMGVVVYVGHHHDVQLKPVAGRVHLKIEDTRLHRLLVQAGQTVEGSRESVGDQEVHLVFLLIIGNNYRRDELSRSDQGGARSWTYSQAH
jgi:NADPH:quinone reductase